MVGLNIPENEAVLDDVELNIPESEAVEGLMSPKKKPTWQNTVYDLVSDKLGVNKSTWDIYREELAKIESRGSGN